MSGSFALLTMSSVLGIGCFGVGMIPLFFVYPKSHMAKLSTLGTGLLLGAALGIIIPEGVESLASAHATSQVPGHKIALSLLLGFMFMLFVEQLVSSHSHSDSLPSYSSQPEANSSEVHFDAELTELEREQGTGNASPSVPAQRGGTDVIAGQKSYPLTFGLIVHGLADGLALGVSALSSSESNPLSNVSFIVFLALVIHKAPTSLALSTSLLATSLPRSECKKHIAFFSASTPIGAIFSYGVFSLLGLDHRGDWTGLALLFSGGTFLYVATVLQPVSRHESSRAQDGLSNVARIVYISIGMLVPFTIGQILGHGHEHTL